MPSPPTRRVVDIVEYLSSRDATPTRLSDIVKALRLNQSTAHSIMTELVQLGWVARDPTSKTFSVGASLSRLAARIERTPSIARAAHDAARRAAAETGYAASVTERAGEQLTITAFVAARDETAAPWHASAGDRLPFAAPFGPACAAWEPQNERRAWVRRSGVTNRTFYTQLDQLLGETRVRGYSVERMSPQMVMAIPAMTQLQAAALSQSMRGHLDEILLEITSSRSATESSRQRQYVGAVTAPIFNLSGRVTHILSVHPFAKLSPHRFHQVGLMLRAEASAIGPSCDAPPAS